MCLFYIVNFAWTVPCGRNRLNFIEHICRFSRRRIIEIMTVILIINSTEWIAHKLFPIVQFEWADYPLAKGWALLPVQFAGEKNEKKNTFFNFIWVRALLWSINIIFFRYCIRHVLFPLMERKKEEHFCVKNVAGSGKSSRLIIRERSRLIISKIRIFFYFNHIGHLLRLKNNNVKNWKPIMGVPFCSLLRLLTQLFLAASDQN